MTREGVTGLAIALSTVMVALSPARIVIALPTVLVRTLPFVSWTASKRPRVIVIAGARPWSVVAPVVITIAIARAAAASPRRYVGVALVVA